MFLTNSLLISLLRSLLCGEQGTRVFGYVTTMGELLNASIMFFAPLIINRIGGKNALLLAGTIMSVRIIGSSFATSALEVVILKTLHMFEVPFLLVGCFKYITSQFEVRFSATIYLVCFCFFKQLAMIFMSVLAGNMYESIGFGALIWCWVWWRWASP